MKKIGEVIKMMKSKMFEMCSLSFSRSMKKIGKIRNILKIKIFEIDIF